MLLLPLSPLCIRGITTRPNVGEQSHDQVPKWYSTIPSPTYDFSLPPPQIRKKKGGWAGKNARTCSLLLVALKSVSSRSPLPVHLSTFSVSNIILRVLTLSWTLLRGMILSWCYSSREPNSSVHLMNASFYQLLLIPILANKQRFVSFVKKPQRYFRTWNSTQLGGNKHEHTKTIRPWARKTYCNYQAPKVGNNSASISYTCFYETPNLSATKTLPQQEIIGVYLAEHASKPLLSRKPHGVQQRRRSDAALEKARVFPAQSAAPRKRRATQSFSDDPLQRETVAGVATIAVPR